MCCDLSVSVLVTVRIICMFCGPCRHLYNRDLAGTIPDGITKSVGLTKLSVISFCFETDAVGDSCGFIWCSRCLGFGWCIRTGPSDLRGPYLSCCSVTYC